MSKVFALLISTELCHAFAHMLAPRSTWNLNKDPVKFDGKDVYYLHIPKAGSSFATTLAHHVCQDHIPEDLTVKEPTGFVNRYAGMCPAIHKFKSFKSGHHPLEKSDVALSHVVTMMRHPLQRIASGYYAKPSRLHDCPTLRRKHCKHTHNNGCDGDIGKEVTNPDVIDPVKYGKCVRDCATNMIIGHGCGHRTKYNGTGSLVRRQTVTLAVHRVAKFGFVGLTEEWLLSVCLWHAKFGGAILEAELANTRPGISSGIKKKSIDPSSSSEYDVKTLFKGWEPSDDMKVYNAAKERFWKEVKDHNLTTEGCSANIKKLHSSHGELGVFLSSHFDQD